MTAQNGSVACSVRRGLCVLALIGASPVLTSSCTWPTLDVHLVDIQLVDADTGVVNEELSDAQRTLVWLGSGRADAYHHEEVRLSIVEVDGVVQDVRIGLVDGWDP